MASESLQTIGDLRRKAIVTDAEIGAAVESYLTGSGGEPFRFASGHTIDVAAAIEAHRPARAALAEKGVTDTYRRTMVRTAVILAVPTRA